MNKDNMNKKQSIQDKINEMKKKKEKSERDRYKQKLFDLSKRSNNKSKMKITFTNDIDKNKLVLWIMTNELMKYTLIDSNEEILIDNELYVETLMEIDNQLINWWDLVNENVELHNIFISIDFYEDMEIENCEVYKRDIQFDNLNIVIAGMYVAEKLLINEDSDITKSNPSRTEEKDNHIDTGDIKDNLFKLIFECMVRLERMRIKKDISCICEDCIGEMKKVEIMITGIEHLDLLKLNDIDISKLKMTTNIENNNNCETTHTDINDNEDRKEQINSFVNNTKKE
jgi:hypothetical protein